MTGAEAYFQLAADRADAQRQARRHQQVMASGVGAFAGAVAGLWFGVGQGASDDVVFTLSLPIVVALVACEAFALSVLWPVGWHVVRLDALREHVVARRLADDELVAWAGREIELTVQENEQRVATRAGWLQLAYGAIAMEIGLVAVLSFVLLRPGSVGL